MGLSEVTESHLKWERQRLWDVKEGFQGLPEQRGKEAQGTEGSLGWGQAQCLPAGSAVTTDPQGASPDPCCQTCSISTHMEHLMLRQEQRSFFSFKTN